MRYSPTTSPKLFALLSDECCQGRCIYGTSLVKIDLLFFTNGESKFSKNEIENNYFWEWGVWLETGSKSVKYRYLQNPILSRIREGMQHVQGRFFGARNFHGKPFHRWYFDRDPNFHPADFSPREFFTEKKRTVRRTKRRIRLQYLWSLCNDHEQYEHNVVDVYVLHAHVITCRALKTCCMKIFSIHAFSISVIICSVSDQQFK